MLQWLRENIVKAIILAALTASVTAWFRGVFDATLRDLLPSGAEISCIGREWIVDHSPFRQPEPTKKVFRILVATLDHDDANLTEAVVLPFQGKKGKGIEAHRTCRVLRIEGAGDRIEEAAAKRGQEWLSRRAADVLVFGEAIGKGEALNLHFLAVGASGDFYQHVFELKSGFLKANGDFSEAVAAQLQAVALASVAPATEERGKYLVEILRPVTGRLEQLIRFPPSGLSARQLADLQFALGLALISIGEQAGDNKALTDAVAAFRETLKENTRARVPLDWAATQHNLGTALAKLGERESGTGRLEEAVAAYREALEEQTRARVPLDWAATQNNLGSALGTLGERESGTARLVEGVSAYRAALEERTRARAPLLWAATQNNLGNALSSLAKREGGTGKLEEAIAAYREALEETTRSRDPIVWAVIQNNLGDALSSLAERDGGTGKLEEAIAAYREALKERARERFPIDWAVTQYNLGTTLSQLAESEGGTGKLDEAVAAYREALKELTHERAALYWARTQTNLGNALLRLAQQESGTSRLEEAVVAYREASKEWTHESSPLDWAMEQSKIGGALWQLWQRENSSATLEQAVSAYRAALTIRNRQRDPVVWADTQCNLGLALWTLGQRFGGSEKMNSGAAACREAQDTLNILLEFRDKRPSAYAHKAGDAMGTLAYKLVLMHDYQSALEAADAAMAAFPDLTWVNINRAHALMFLGRLDEARTIFLGHRGEIISSNELWETSVRTDFESLRRAALSHPLMDEVEQAFAKP